MERKIDIALKTKNIIHILIFISYAALIFFAAIDKKWFIFISYIISCLLSLLYIYSNIFIMETLFYNIKYKSLESYIYNKRYYNEILIDHLKIMDNNLKWIYSASDIGVVLASIIISIIICIYGILYFSKIVSLWSIAFYVYILGKFIIRFMDSYINLKIAIDVKEYDMERSKKI